jgi:hypothetical protein
VRWSHQTLLPRAATLMNTGMSLFRFLGDDRDHSRFEIGECDLSHRNEHEVTHNRQSDEMEAAKKREDEEWTSESDSPCGQRHIQRQRDDARNSKFTKWGC